MSVIAFPAGLRIGAFSIGQARFDMMETSDATGHQSARLLGPPRWRLSMTSPEALPYADAVVWESLLLRLRGGVNHLACGDRVRRVPRGTMRGTLTLNSSAAAGAVALSITGGAGQANTTLLEGDWLQIGTGLGTSQLVKVVTAATANGSGVIAATVEPPLRTAFSSSTAVTWQDPVAYFRMQGMPQWAYGAGPTAGGFSLDLLEAWT